jgi:hypothetical protein
MAKSLSAPKWKFTVLPQTEWTQADAEMYLKLPAYEGERTLVEREHFVQEYAEKFGTGEMYILDNIKMADVKGVRYKLNGQTVSAAMLRAGVKSWPCHVVLYILDTKEEYITLYKEIDRGTEKRTPWTLLRMRCLEAGGAWGEATKKVATLAATAVGFRKYRMAYKRLQPSERCEMPKVPGTQDFVAFLNKICEKNSKHLLKESIFCAMAETWYTDKAQAEIFWLHVRDADGIAASNPAHTLRDKLLSRDSLRRSSKGFLEPLMSWNELYGRCIVAWNNVRKKTKKTWRETDPVPKAM